jgi:hypothetical protein
MRLHILFAEPNRVVSFFSIVQIDTVQYSLTLQMKKQGEGERERFF